MQAVWHLDGKSSNLLGWDTLRIKDTASLSELKEWLEWYLPPASVPKDALILDVGARDGDSVFFYIQHGYSHFRLIEPNPDYYDDLDANTKEFERIGARVEIRKKAFTPNDLNGVAFAKFDCEGCEREIDFSLLKIPWVKENHAYAESDMNGIYPYVKALGWEKSAKENA